MRIIIKETKNVVPADVIGIYKANGWSSANKPEELLQALLSSHSFITAWDDDKLIGLGNAISDGHLVVYYPHLIVHPAYQKNGVGELIINKFQEKYKDFHQQVLIADDDAVNFYKKNGFSNAGKTQSMWIYKGDDH